MGLGSVLVKGVGMYLPSNEVSNEEMASHFSERGISVNGLYESVGRKTRFFKDEDETSTTMSFKAAENVIKKLGVNKDSIDGVIYVSDSPEYTSPSNAIVLHKWLGLKNAHFVLDMNQNCTGVITALDVVTKYMKGSHRLNRVLVTGAFNASQMAHKDNPVTYGVLSDGSSAVIVDKVNEQEKGIIDSGYHTDSSHFEMMMYPKCGYSNISSEQIDDESKKLNWDHESDEFIPGEFVKVIEPLLERNGLTPNDVQHYIASQFSKKLIHVTSEKLGVSADKFTFVSDKFGYCGNASPMFAFGDLLEKGSAKEGDFALIFSIGSGHVVSVVLYRY